MAKLPAKVTTRRAQITALLAAEPHLSNVEIAERLGWSRDTIRRDREAMGPAPIPGLQDASGMPVAGAEPGNTRALTHGSYSESVIGPLADDAREYIDRLCEGHPASGPHFEAARNMLARKLAIAANLGRFFDAEGGVPRIRPDGTPSSATTLELDTLQAIENLLEKMGLTPTSAAKLGVDLTKQATLAEELAKAESARKAAEARAVGSGVSNGE